MKDMKEPFDWEKSNRTMRRLDIAMYICLTLLALSLLAQIVLTILCALGAP